MADVRTPELVINKLTKQQYENIQNPSATEIYLVPEDEEHKPICYPTTASEVKTTSMVVKSSVSDNGKILTENGFVYNTSGNPTVSDTKVVCDLGVGVMQKELTGLTRNTQYHIKSYGQNASGLVYGSELVQRTSINPIPSTYQLVEYLESSGTQYINTGYYPVASDTISTKCAYFNASGNQFMGAFSASGSFNRRCHFGVFNSLLTIWVNTGSSIITRGFSNLETEFKFTQTICSIDTTIGINDNVYPNLYFYLFARNSNGSPNNFSTVKVYNFYVERDLVKILNFYPVYRIANNKPGMYDIVNGVFYTNQGTGEFTVGPDKEFDD